MNSTDKEDEMTYMSRETAKNAEKWVADANKAANKYGEARSFRLISIDGNTASGRQRFTVEITDAR